MTDLGPGIPQPQESATAATLRNLSGSLEPTNLAPMPVRDFLSTGSVEAPRINKELPNNLTSLENKYTELAPIINELPPEARNALLKMDSDRVSAGSKPLTREETLLLAQTWVDQRPATEAPRRKPLDVVGNTLSNLGTIVRSIPQIPGALVNEVTSLGEEGEGSNSISRLLNSPGVRMLPGAYIGANLAEGSTGIRELVSNPLFTALDALPAAGAAAKTTKVGQLATDAATAAGRNPRPLAALLTQRVDDAGMLVDRVPRAALKELRDSSRVGQTIDAAFGGRARDATRMFEQARMKVVSQVNGIERHGDDTVVKAAQEAVELDQRYMNEHGWTLDDIAGATRRIQTERLENLSDVELSYKRDLDDLTDRLGSELELTDELIRFDGEFYRPDDAAMLRDAKDRYDHFGLVRQYRDEWRTPSGTLTADDLNAAIDDALNRTSDQLRNREFTHIVNMIDAYGLDVTDARAQLRYARDGHRTPQQVAGSLRTLIDEGWETRRARASVLNVIDTLRAMRGRGDAQATRLLDALQDGNSKRITQALKNIEKRQTRTLDPTMIDDIRSLRDRYRNDIGGRWYTRNRADRARETYEATRDRTPPARFGPLIGKLTLDGVETTVRGPGGIPERVSVAGARREFIQAEEVALGRKLTEPEVARLTQALVERRWGQFSFGNETSVADLYRKIEDEVAQTWRGLRREGYEPSFVHVASKGRVRQTLRPRVGPVPVSLTQVKERALDFSPGINDAGVAVSHQAVEILSRRASEEALDNVIAHYGISERDLREMYAVPAREAAQRDPMWGFEGELGDIVSRRYTALTPEQMKAYGFNPSSSRLGKYEQNTMFIPKSVAKVLDDLAQPKSVLGGVFDPVTKLFRISVVGLSPRTHLYNILGGATMVMGEAGPGAFRYVRQAREWATDPSKITDAELRRTIGSQRAIMADFDDLTRHSDKVKKAQAVAAVAGGRTLGRLWQQIQQSKASGAVGTVVEKSLDLNAVFDDAYRIMAYLHGRDRALTRGMSRDVAENAGLEMMRKSMMDWSSLTPIERGVMKSVFPFYSFMNHAIRYVLRYPVDHPLRAGILGSFGQLQETDGDLLPDRFQSFFFFGSPDADGRQNALSLGPVNPFGDIANMLTFSGFLSATNPAISTVLESVGLARGEAELYPSLRFNPETGRLDGSRGNPLINFAQSTIPQSQILLSLFGANTDFTSRLERDPAGAIRTLWSAGGLPIIWRNFSVPEEAFKADLARQRAEGDVLNDALRSGNWQNANRYPGLAGLQQQIGALPPETLAAFTPPESQAIRTQLETLLAGQPASFNVDGVDPDVAREALDTILNSRRVSAQVQMGGI